MYLCYQVATPDVAIAPSVTAYQGPLEQSFHTLASLGYQGAELMTLDPSALEWTAVRDLARRYGLRIPMICTGEVYGQLGVSFTHAEQEIRHRAVERVEALIDFAGFLGADVNIGRVRGQYRHDVEPGKTVAWAAEALRHLSGYAADKGVRLALEPVNILQSNFINTMEEGARLIAEVGHPNCRLMMDVFHMHMEEKDVCAAIQQFLPLTVHVHLADSNRRYPGQCGLDLPRILRTFSEAGYAGAYCTEIFQLPDQDTAARESIAYLRPIFAGMEGPGGVEE